MKKIVITPFYMLKTVIHIIEKYLLRETFCNQVCPDKHTKYCGAYKNLHKFKKLLS